MNSPTSAPELRPVTREDFPALRTVAESIWREHYAGIVAAEQIDYMLTGRFADPALQATIRAPHAWLDMLWAGGVPLGYCACELAAGDDGAAAMKLGQLYLLRTHRGRGLGRLMLRHVEGRARECGREIVFLQVNKRNNAAIRFYEAAGYAVARAAVFDIGGGFVMDDYVMDKRLGRA